MSIKCSYLSIHEIGKRTNQEDSIYPKLGEVVTDSDYFILCDGMGGHDCGEVASLAVCDAMSSYINAHPETDFESVLNAAYDALDAADNQDEKKMGTTMTFVKFNEDSCIVAHIGDSRVYQIRPSEKRILYVTRDHSLVNDLIACGELTEEEAKFSKQKNVITRAMQPHQEKRSKADVAILSDIREGDYFYMCSDGMLEISEDEDIVNVLSMDVSDQEKVEILKGVTVDNKDNHSAHLIRVVHVTEEQKHDESPSSKSSNKSTKLKFAVLFLVLCVLGFAGYFIYKHFNTTSSDVPEITEEVISEEELPAEDMTEEILIESTEEDSDLKEDAEEEVIEDEKNNEDKVE